MIRANRHQAFTALLMTLEEHAAFTVNSDSMNAMILTIWIPFTWIITGGKNCDARDTSRYG